MRRHWGWHVCRARYTIACECRVSDAAELHPPVARGDAPVFSNDGNRARASSVLTNVDCSWPVGVCMPVEARLVRDSIRPTSVDLTVSTLHI